MADRYWVGGTGTWDNSAGSKWSTTSGGAGGAAVPTSADDVYFNAASGAVTVTSGATNNCKNLTLTGFTGTLDGSSALNVYGNFVGAATTTWSRTNYLTFVSSGAQTITTNGMTVGGPIRFNNASGTWTLQDDLTNGDLYVVDLLTGTFNSNGKAVTIGRFFSSNTNTRALTMGASVWTLKNGNSSTLWDMSTTTGLTFNAGTSTIRFNKATQQTFNTGGLTYYNVEYTNSGSSTISGNATFNKLSSTVNVTLAFPAGTVITVSQFAVQGDLYCNAAPSQFSLSKSSGTVNLQNCQIRDCIATGGATWNAVNGALNKGNNSGWYFSHQMGNLSPTLGW